MLDRRLQIAEYLLIAGFIIGWIVSAASGQIIYGAVPMSVALLLNPIDRFRLEQRMLGRLSNATAQLHRQLSQESHVLYEQLQGAIASLQAQLPRYFSQLEASQPQSSVSEATLLAKQAENARQELALRRSTDRNISEPGSVQAVAIRPNGQLIAGGGAGSIVRIWQRD